jgi:serine/threonine protein kinase
MPLTTGTRLGQYEILGPLGAGGMGEVYRARDTKLNRDVAVKVLAEAVANDRERLARFAGEAQALAALNHPNIATIYGVEDGATQAIVMELVEGATLADLMRGAVDRGPSGRVPRPPGGNGRHGKPRRVGLPLDQALAIARQIADALETAHSFTREQVDRALGLEFTDDCNWKHDILDSPHVGSRSSPHTLDSVT